MTAWLVCVGVWAIVVLIAYRMWRSRSFRWMRRDQEAKP